MTMLKPPYQQPATTRPKAKPRADLAQDKGDKFEPFFILPLGHDRRSMALERRLDQRR